MKLFTYISIVSLLPWTVMSAKPPDGVLIDNGSCSSEQVVAIRQAFQVALEQVKAGLATVSSREQKSLFEFFFRPSDRTAVTKVYQALQQYYTGGGTPVAYICKDVTNSCTTRNSRAYFIHDYPVETLKGVPPPLSRIILCPRFFARPVSPDPCKSTSLELYTPAQDSRPGDQSYDTYQSTMALHELLHVPYIGGPRLPFLQDLANRLVDIHSLLDLQAAGYQVPPDQVKNAVPLNNVDSYTTLAAWAWMLNQQKAKCPKSYPLFNAVKIEDRVELRRLLGENEDDSNDIILHPNRMLGVVNCPGNCTAPVSGTFTSFTIGDVSFSLGSGFDFTAGSSNGNFTTADGTTLNLTYSGP